MPQRLKPLYWGSVKRPKAKALGYLLDSEKEKIWQRRSRDLLRGRYTMGRSRMR
jgi:hypothetical protein